MRISTKESEPIPRRLSDQIDGVLVEKDVRVSPGSRIFAKVLIFESKRRMLAGYLCYAGRKHPQNTQAIVDYLDATVVDIGQDGIERNERVVTDPRYFCVMFFHREGLTQEIVTHESVHAGFVYARRTSRRWRHSTSDVQEDEMVCYPAGRIANEISKMALGLRS